MSWRTSAMEKNKERGLDMKCPKCRRYTLKQGAEAVVCTFCGYQLSAGQEINYRLFQLLRKEEGRGKLRR